MNPVNPARRRTVLAGLAAAALAPMLAACGGEDSAPQSGGDAETDTGDTGDTGAAGGAEDGALPTTLTHKFGETTVEAAPQRVVCVGLIEQDALLALGIVPVATTYWFGDEEKNGINSWAQETFDGLEGAEQPTLLDATNGIPVEEVAALAPDLILGLYSGMTQREYDLLSKIAPTVAQSADYTDYGMPWDESTLVVGQSIGRPEAGQALVDDVKEQIAQAAADHPEFEGRTAAVVTPYEGLGLYGPEDPRSRILVELGLTLPPIITETEMSEFFLSVSSERTSELADVDAVVWLDVAADKQVEALFEQTSAFEEGRWIDISDADGDYYIAHSFVTPLSIPYVLERYVPQLAAAVDADPATEVEMPVAD